MDNLWMTGWWFTYPSEKYEFVNWDDDIPKSYGKIKHVPVTTNQIRYQGCRQYQGLHRYTTHKKRHDKV